MDNVTATWDSVVPPAKLKLMNQVHFCVQGDMYINVYTQDVIVHAAYTSVVATYIHTY